MIQFNVGGKTLDTKKLSLAFKRTNILFAFDDVSCERTTAFDIPATAKNNAILSMSKDVHFYGAGMRTRIAAQMQDGACVKNGYIYIDTYQDGVYKGIFVTGELLGLKQLKDAGNISELSYNMGDVVTWDETSVKEANTTAARGRFVAARYLSNMTCVPSWSLNGLVQAVGTYLFGQAGRIQAIPDKYRIVPQKMNGMREQGGNFASEQLHASPSTSSSPTNVMNTLATAYPVATGSRASARAILVVQINNQNRYWLVQQFWSGQDLEITFPASLSNDVFLITLPQSGSESAQLTPWAASWFLGGYSFTPLYDSSTQTYSYRIDGTPLGGRTVKIEAGTPFVFVNLSDFRNERYEPSLQGYGFTFGAGGQDYDFQTIARGASDAKIGNVILANDNMPNCTLVELLKMSAALQGLALNYTDGQGVTFDALAVDTWPVRDWTSKVIKYGQMSRKVGDWAQKNRVGFDETDAIKESQRVATVYEIDNENIAKEKDLSRFNFYEGLPGVGLEGIGVEINSEDSDKWSAPAWAVMETTTVGAGSPYCQRVSFPKNSTIERMCTASTDMTVTVRLSRLEFEQLRPNVVLYINGAKYVWIECNWKNDAAEIKISKI